MHRNGLQAEETRTDSVDQLRNILDELTTDSMPPEEEPQPSSKSMTQGPKFREISVAIADKIGGPYVDSSKNPLISYKDKGRDIEDPYAFFYRDTYYMILEDRMDVASLLGGKPSEGAKPGGNRPGLLYKSKDGISWDRPELSYNTVSHYFDKELSRSERPHILWKDGKPEYLFLANHDHSHAGFYLKIEGWEKD